MSVRFRILPATRGQASASPGAAGPLVARDVEVAGAPAEIRLGRAPDLELPLPFAALSALHARVLRTDDGWVVEDAGSTNGTWLGGARLAPGERRTLAPGDEILLANIRVRFEGEGPPAAAAEGTGTIARRLVDDLFAASPTQAPTLRVLRGAPPQRLALVEPDRAYVAGRGEACALSLGVEEVSREHATFTRGRAGVVVRDLGSKNGVQLGGARLEGERLLADGDVLEIGPVSVALDDPVGRYLRELEAAPPPEPVVAPEIPEAASSRPDAEVPVQVAVGSRSTRLPLVVGGLALLLLAAVAVLLVVSSH
jgi:pSer/pThr/pTyr-binding forkhead associated (FHA) protein